MLSRQSDETHTIWCNSTTGRSFGVVKVLVTAFLLLTAAIYPVQALIYPGNSGWSAGVRYTNSFAISMGTGPRALDNFDHYDELAYISDSGWTGGSYHLAGSDGWDGLTGFYYADARAVMNHGETKVWMLYIWAVPGSPFFDLSLSWEAPTYNDPSIQATLELVQKPQGVTGGPALGTVWTTPPTSFTLPRYTTTNGLTGYGFKFTLMMLPEPTSLVVLVGCLLGAAGLMRRRR